MDRVTPEVVVPEGTILPRVALVGEDGNAFAIMARVSKALRKAGNPKSVVDSYMEQSTAGDYDHLLRVAMRFTVDQHGDEQGVCLECGHEECDC